MSNCFSKGSWLAHIPNNLINSGHVTVETENGEHIYTVECYKSTIQQVMANANLIAAAGTVANQLAEQGYDSKKVIESLPEILILLDRCSDLLEDGMTSKHIKNIFSNFLAK